MACSVQAGVVATPLPLVGFAGREDDFVGGIGLPGNSWPFV